MTELKTLGMHHVALFVEAFEACVEFYHHILKMEIEWQPDADNVYLTSGSDNLALHRRTYQVNEAAQRLDHIGFILPDIATVNAWYLHFQENNVEVLTKPKTHRDGATSFYCLDPDGNRVQFIHHPPLEHLSLCRQQ